MTVREFIAEVEACYGGYPTAMRGYVGSWLQKSCTVDPGKLFGHVLQSYSTRWGRPPGIVEFKESAKALQQAEAIAGIEADMIGQQDRALIEREAE